MYKYILKRLLTLIPVILGVVLIIFLIMDLTPGDPARMVLGNMASEEALDAFREEQGLNDPLLVRYVRYVLDLCRGDLGNSYKTNRSVMTELMDRFPATIQLAVASIFFALVVSVPIGIVSAVKQNSVFDNVGMVVALLGIAMPAFWLGLILIIAFSLNLNWLPSGGYGTWQNLILPAFTAGAACAANIARITRSSMLEIIRQDYMRTARAKGVSKTKVVLHHGMKNCWIPVITVAGLQFGTLLGGIVIIENVFAWPGVGNFLLTSITSKDTPCVLGSIVLFTVVFSIVNLIVDIIYAFVDPRIKAQYK
mgnify:CR=1 FL=1